MSNNKFLPIGTVVKINNSSKLLMITGYFLYNYNNNIEKYDYVTCTYPYGILFENSTKGINHNEITEIVYEGYRNKISDELNVKLQESLSSSTIKSTPSKLNVAFDENGIIVADADEKRIEDNSYLTMIENSPINNPFIYKGSDTNQSSVIPEDSEEWSIFKNIKFDENGNVTEADEYTNDEIETFKNDEALNKQQETESVNFKFDADGNIISDKTVQSDSNENSSNIKFDENGFVTEFNEENQPLEETFKFDADGNIISDKTVQSDSNENSSNIKFDENGNIISDGTETIESASSGNFSDVKFDENGFVILNDQDNNEKDQIIVIDDEI